MQKLFSILLLLTISYSQEFGCTDPDACNYNPLATQDDATCLYLDECGECGGPGATYNCGCFESGSSCNCLGEIEDGYCDCNGNMLGCDNVCGSGLIPDVNGVCCSIEDRDCGGICYGNSHIMCDGVCSSGASYNAWIDECDNCLQMDNPIFNYEENLSITLKRYLEFRIEIISNTVTITR